MGVGQRVNWPPPGISHVARVFARCRSWVGQLQAHAGGEGPRLYLERTGLLVERIDHAGVHPRRRLMQRHARRSVFRLARCAHCQSDQFFASSTWLTTTWASCDAGLAVTVNSMIPPAGPMSGCARQPFAAHWALSGGSARTNWKTLMLHRPATKAGTVDHQLNGAEK